MEPPDLLPHPTRGILDCKRMCHLAGPRLVEVPALLLLLLHSRLLDMLPEVSLLQQQGILPGLETRGLAFLRIEGDGDDFPCFLSKYFHFFHTRGLIYMALWACH
jgi:hypothetical protein